jgi:hypothetical protein
VSLSSSLLLGGAIIKVHLLSSEKLLVIAKEVLLPLLLFNKEDLFKFEFFFFKPLSISNISQLTPSTSLFIFIFDISLSSSFLSYLLSSASSV